MRELRVAIVGFGKIARTHHLPAIAAASGAALVAIADPVPAAADVPQFPSLEALLGEGPEIDAVALCTPPQLRAGEAFIALAAGKHVLLEKPPGATVSEIAPLLAAARQRGCTLFASWHSRFAPAVEPMRQLLAERRIEAVTITWKEDVRVWHPGQAWIFKAGGFGVYDPGINALSILTRILPQPLFVIRAEHHVPSNCEAPIAVELRLEDAARLPIRASFDFLQSDPQTWDIRVDTDQGPVLLRSGGARLMDGDRLLIDREKQEYPRLYRRFVKLAAQQLCDVDLSPLQLVADAFLLSRQRSVEPFEDRP